MVALPHSEGPFCHPGATGGLAHPGRQGSSPGRLVLPIRQAELPSPGLKSLRDKGAVRGSQARVAGVVPLGLGLP